MLRPEQLQPPVRDDTHIRHGSFHKLEHVECSIFGTVGVPQYCAPPQNRANTPANAKNTDL
jgi:hypothetical protein